MKKDILGMIMAVFVFIAMLPGQVLAADNEMPVRLKEGESAVIEAELSQAYEEKISSLQFSIKVTGEDGNPAETDVLEKIEVLTFLPSPEVTSKAKICDQRYHKDTGVLDVYIAGTEPLFGEDNKLTVGTVTADDKTGGKTDIFIQVEQDSFRVVKGNGLETITGDEDSVYIVAAQQPIKPEQPQEPDSAQKPQEPAGPTIDKSRLQSALEIVSGLTESDYTAESFALLKKAAEAGKTVLNDSNATSEEVEQSADEILNAIGALVPVSATSADNNAPSKVENQGNEAAKTGDWTSVRICMVLVVLSLIVIAGIVIWKKYHKSSHKTV
ncbi:MAG: hypothetical protein K2N34_13865 [Lachnospiraceae bacterium]|nr:hypothetical protein [Lachnospiraceae bacterium]